MTPDEMRSGDVPHELTGDWGGVSTEVRAIWAVGAEICERLDAILIELRLPKIEKAMAPHRERLRERAEKAEARVRELETMLRDLLAVIHRDGGHRTGAVGMNQSYLDAQRVVAKAYAEVDELRAAQAVLAGTTQADLAFARIRELELERDRARISSSRWAEFAYELVRKLVPGSLNEAWALEKRDRLAAEEDAGK